MISGYPAPGILDCVKSEVRFPFSSQEILAPVPLQTNEEVYILPKSLGIKSRAPMGALLFLIHSRFSLTTLFLRKGSEKVAFCNLLDHK